MICAIIVMNINHHDNSKGVPSWAKKFFLQKVAGCLCIRQEQFLTEPQQLSTEGDNNNFLLETKQKPKSEVAELRDFLERRAEEKEALERNEEEWQFLAIVIDRMLFCIFGATVVLFLLAIFIQLLAMPRPDGM